jgi:dGTPase
MNRTNQSSELLAILADLNMDESRRLAPAATRSAAGIRRHPEPHPPYRQQFMLDADRILHSRAYTRYIDKTQVFSLIDNDHITHRVLHVQLVARIARTIGRFLRLNEDLIEAIALGHDIGHPPFGHDGESFLAQLCVDHGLPPFQHNLQSVRFLDQLEKKGRGWNLCLQVLDGILCHDGEIHARVLRAEPITTFVEFARKLAEKTIHPGLGLLPGTLEGCVVRMADTIGYIGRDIEDAITLGLVKRIDIPADCRNILGETNGTIVYNLVTDLIKNSRVGATLAESSIGFSEQTAELLGMLKRFNYEHIYLAPAIKKDNPLIRQCYRQLFEHYLKCLLDGRPPSSAAIDLMTDIDLPQGQNYSPAERVRDFIAGMTDDFFLAQAKDLGCHIPSRKKKIVVC